MPPSSGSSALLARIVQAYEPLVRAELAGKHDVIEAARNALAALIDDARKVLRS